MVKEKEVCAVIVINKEKVEHVKAQLVSQRNIERTAKLFKALGDPTRQKIVQALLIDELCVCDLASIVNVSISAISHQLKTLRDLNLVKSHRDGKMIIYSVSDAHVRSIISQTLMHLDD